MAKLTLTNIADTRQSSAATTINANSDLIETAIENTISRDGTSPNHMEADLDMNSNRILNLPAPLSNSEPLRRGDTIDNGIPTDSNTIEWDFDVPGILQAHVRLDAQLSAASYRMHEDIFSDQTTTYTLQSTDNGKVVTINSATPVSLGVPTGLPVGFSCNIFQRGLGQVTVIPVGTTVNSYLSLTKLAGTYAVATLFSYATNTFVLSGALE